MHLLDFTRIISASFPIKKQSISITLTPSIMNDLFAYLYEGFPPLNLFYISNNNFSDNMYQSGSYVSIGLIMLISSLVSELLYYFFLSNYGSFYKKMYWFLWMVAVALINFAVAYSFSFSTIGPDATFTEYFTYSMVNVLWTMIFCFLFSIAFKFKSIKASRTPF